MTGVILSQRPSNSTLVILPLPYFPAQAGTCTRQGGPVGCLCSSSWNPLLGVLLDGGLHRIPLYQQLSSVWFGLRRFDSGAPAKPGKHLVVAFIGVFPLKWQHGGLSSSPGSRGPTTLPCASSAQQHAHVPAHRWNMLERPLQIDAVCLLGVGLHG